MIHQLEAESIQLEFDGRKILSGIYLKCETGKITALLGRNGEGKSCLMKIIHGSLHCERSIRFDNAFEPEAYKRPGLLLYLPQFNFIPQFLTLKRIFKNFSVEYAGFEKRFPEFTSKYRSCIGSLSGGNQRLVALYVIVMSSSRFAILDEPFTHMDPLHIEKVKELLLEQKNNKGMLITDHMYRTVIDICDNIYVLANGATHLIKRKEDIEAFGYARRV